MPSYLYIIYTLNILITNSIFSIKVTEFV